MQEYPYFYYILKFSNSGIVRSFKFILKVGLEESIVNALYGLRISLSYLTFLHESVHNRLFNANFEDNDLNERICYTNSLTL
jgi:hypothetical protein